jgi:hypothetical protein
MSSVDTPVQINSSIRAAACWCCFALLAIASGQICATQPDGPDFRPMGIPASIDVKGVELPYGATTARYYVIKSKDDLSDNLVVFIPGSGCDGAFHLDSHGKAVAGSEVFALPYLDKINIVVLDQPGVPQQYASEHPGLAEGCPESYLKNDNFASILNAYRTELNEFLSRHRPAIKKVLIVSASDGVVFAAGLAKDVKQTTQMTLISGFGTSQALSQIYDAVDLDKLEGDGGHSVENGPGSVSSKFAQVATDPTSTSRFVGGHPYSRWSTTAQVSSASEVLKIPYSVKLAVVQGGMDTSWSPAAFRMGVAMLMLHRRPFAVEYIPCADHYLICAQDAGRPKRLEDAVHHSIDWFLGSEESPSGFTSVF